MTAELPRRPAVAALKLAPAFCWLVLGLIGDQAKEQLGWPLLALAASASVAALAAWARWHLRAVIHGRWLGLGVAALLGTVTLSAVVSGPLGWWSTGSLVLAWTAIAIVLDDTWFRADPRELADLWAMMGLALLLIAAIFAVSHDEQGTTLPPGTSRSELSWTFWSMLLILLLVLSSLCGSPHQIDQPATSTTPSRQGNLSTAGGSCGPRGPGRRGSEGSQRRSDRPDWTVFHRSARPCVVL